MELVERVEALIEVLDRDGRAPLDPADVVALSELYNVVVLLEEARTNPLFAMVGANIKKTQDYGHTLVMLAAKSFLEAVGNGAVEFVATATAARPDLRVHTSDGTDSFHVEIYVPQALIHPAAVVSDERCTTVIRAALKRKKVQLRGERNALLLVGGLGCDASTIEALTVAAETELRRHTRPTQLGVAIFSRSVVSGVTGTPDDPRLTVYAGSNTRLAANPSYTGAFRMKDEIPAGAPLRRLSPEGTLELP